MTDNQITILKTALDWTKAEMVSSACFVFFGLIFIGASICFWQFGKTDTAKAYIIPLLVTGSLLVVLGVGLLLSNQFRLSGFPDAFESDYIAFIAAEIERASKTIKSYETAIHIVFPLIILVSVILLFFMKSPIWQASLIATIAMIAVIAIIDSNAKARMAIYHDELITYKRTLSVDG
ncbi:MAG: hypothetical protein ACON44_07080 [Candidatus Puniceispirillaceae bacterium]